MNRWMRLLLMTDYRERARDFLDEKNREDN